MKLPVFVIVSTGVICCVSRGVLGGNKTLGSVMQCVFLRFKFVRRKGNERIGLQKDQKLEASKYCTMESLNGTWAWESHVTANGRWLHIPSLTQLSLFGVTGCGFDRRKARERICTCKLCCRLGWHFWLIGCVRLGFFCGVGGRSA